MSNTAYLQLSPVSWSEVIGRAATPVNNVFVLTLAPQLPLPVGDVQVVVREALAEFRVAEDSVEERLEQTGSQKWLIFKTASAMVVRLHILIKIGLLMLTI